MASASILLRPEGPWLHAFVAPQTDAWDFVMLRLQQLGGARLACRTIRGNKSRTKQSLFDEFAAALQFPCYFGENWDAFDECINDLEWLCAEAYVLLIVNSTHLLEGEPAEQVDLFLQTLASAGREWSKPVDGEFARKARPFHVLLQCTQPEEQQLRDRLSTAKIASSPFHIPHN